MRQKYKSLAKIIALDIGEKRTGIAETDPLQIIAEPVETIASEALIDYLKKRFAAEAYETIVVGDPKSLDDGDSHNSKRVRTVVDELKKKFPDKSIVLEDERFSSKMALQVMIDGGMKKKRRRNKAEIDKISAAIILQSYMGGR